MCFPQEVREMVVAEKGEERKRGECVGVEQHSKKRRGDKRRWNRTSAREAGWRMLEMGHPFHILLLLLSLLVLLHCLHLRHVCAVLVKVVAVVV